MNNQIVAIVNKTCCLMRQMGIVIGGKVSEREKQYIIYVSSEVSNKLSFTQNTT